MAIELPPLPYGLDELNPHISRDTLEHHYSKHHAGYVSKLNELIKGTPFDEMKVEEIILETSDRKREHKDIFNNAGQAWSHAFYWNGMTGRQTQPSRTLRSLIEKNFGTLEQLQSQFSEAGTQLFGSGWVWLARDEEGNLSILPLPNAHTPLSKSLMPLLVCDVWEHAYYLDYKSERKKYLAGFWRLINWPFVEKNIDEPSIEFRRARTETEPEDRIRH